MSQCEYEFHIGKRIAYCIHEDNHSGPHETNTGEMIVLDEMGSVSDEQWQLLKRIAKPDGSVSAIAMLEEIKRLTADLQDYKDLYRAEQGVVHKREAEIERASAEGANLTACNNGLAKMNERLINEVAGLCKVIDYAKSGVLEQAIIDEVDNRVDALAAGDSGSQKLPSVHAVHPQKENHMFHPGGNADYCICGAGKADAIHRLAPVDSSQLQPEIEAESILLELTEKLLWYADEKGAIHAPQIHELVNRASADQRRTP